MRSNLDILNNLYHSNARQIDQLVRANAEVSRAIVNIITPTKEKNETKLLQKINLSVISSLLNGGVKAPRRALDTLDDIKF